MNYRLIFNRFTQYFKDGKSVKKKLFLKMNIMDYKNTTVNFLDLFDHIGEAKLFNYIAKYCFDSKEEYYYHHDKSAKKIAEQLSIAPPTQFKYLALLVSKELLLKEVGKRGYYKVNPKYIE